MRKTTASAWLLLLALGSMGQSLLTEAPRPRISARIAAREGYIDFHFQVPDNHHVTDLKNNFFAITVAENEHAVATKTIFPAGAPYRDEKVFKGEFSVRLFLEPSKPLKAPAGLDFDVSFQICQEYPEELCYPPDQTRIHLVIGPDFRAAAATGDRMPLGRRLEKLIRNRMGSASPLLFLLVFFAGFLASLTPCVYPVIPIIMGFVGSRSQGRRLKGFALSLFFVLGLSLVYSLLGMIAAKTGALIGASLQNPVVVVAIAVVFILMGLSLAGLFAIPVPSSISAKLAGGHKNEFLGAAIVGGASAIIAAPCVGPVLVALLSWISQSGSVFLGFWLTFAFSLGLSVIFLLAGTFSGAIAALPRGGGWMSLVKYFFAAMLVAGGVFFLGGILPAWASILLWGIYLIGLAVLLVRFRPRSENRAGLVLALAIALLAVIGGVFLCYQGLAKGFSPPAQQTEAGEALAWMAELAASRERARAENKPLLVDAWAEWCAACRELDEKTFSRAEVREALRDYILVKLDFTRKSAASERLQKELGIVGMPTIIIFDAAGGETRRFSGFVNAGELLKLIRR